MNKVIYHVGFNYGTIQMIQMWLNDQNIEELKLIKFIIENFSLQAFGNVHRQTDLADSLSFGKYPNQHLPVVENFLMPIWMILKKYFKDLNADN